MDALVTTRARVILAVQLTVLVSATIVAVVSSRATDWQPVELVLLLLFLTVGSDLVTMDWRGFRISGAFLAFVLSMALLGPAPAAAIGAAVSLIDLAVARRPWNKAINNLMVFTTFPLVGGLLINALHGRPIPGSESTIEFPVVVLIVFMLTNLLNFSMVAVFESASGGPKSSRASARSTSPCSPSSSRWRLLTAGVAFVYQRVGVGAVGLLAVVLFVCQYLLRAGIQAYERGEELQNRTRELASLQVGLHQHRPPDAVACATR